MRGKFVSAQKIWFSIAGTITSERNNQVHIRSEVSEYLPLLSYSVFDVAPLSQILQAKYIISLNLAQPATSLAGLLQGKAFSASIVQRLE